jgi:hypothetical protein
VELLQDVHDTEQVAWAWRSRRSCADPFVVVAGSLMRLQEACACRSRRRRLLLGFRRPPGQPGPAVDARDGPRVNQERRPRMCSRPCRLWGGRTADPWRSGGYQARREGGGDLVGRDWRCGGDAGDRRGSGRMTGGSGVGVRGFPAGGRAEIFSWPRGDGLRDEFGRAQLRSSNRASQPGRAESLYSYEAGNAEIPKPV